MSRQRWRFGVGQTAHQERAEMRAAQAAGRSEEYVAGQEYRRLIEAELERRRARKRRGGGRDAR